MLAKTSPAARSPHLIDALRRFEDDLLALGLDPRDFRLETASAEAAKILLRHLRDELWPIELRDMAQWDGSLSIGRLTIGMSADIGQTHAASEPA
jgi:hypothetical protein